ncbi:MAG: TetM/TetW/TetO/TetS family tetracycline resistance ribosomal protection protein [Eubacteriales bacterium]|nr:TetM/TetW/TetO/TetS family tetracycline resistance ribosomal protection protein [Eubacteriales bacterium]
MHNTSENKPGKIKKHINIGLLAHVDAGKTTLAETLLYLAGAIRKPGRVDYGDAFLDTYDMEKARGITIFSKQAQLSLENADITLLDTPGHVDFSAEMERTLQILDYAILVISGADGVQGHAQTLWRLLKRYEIPTFLFINKMDQTGTDREALMKELKKRFGDSCVCFSPLPDKEEFYENVAVCDEKLLESYLENGNIDTGDIARLIALRQIFPCYFGSALKIQGVRELVQGIEAYTCAIRYPDEFGARVFKIARDEQGNRLTYLKVTGGTLKVKMPLTNRNANAHTQDEDIWEEKADQLRVYSGAGYELVKEALAGSICAVTGLSRTRCGQGLGREAEAELPLLEPVLTYRIELPKGCDVHPMFLKLLQLEEEEPELHLVWNERLQEIHAQVMGEVQIEILRDLIYKRFGVLVEFGTGSIVYKETIKAPVEGVGHFEPLRHYAEVHLLLEPGERGSGLEFSSVCSEDILDKNWQRLILTHLEEKAHRGVLTGSEITDMRIVLLIGRAHQKHTEGGDFRQATYRAVRQGLMKAETVLLEPVYEFRLEVPTENVGRALSDLERMHADFQPPELEGELSVLTGCAPVNTMGGYQKEVVAYTRGRGRLFCSLKGYQPCHNQDEVAAARAYDADADTENPSSSVFCAHGAGFLVSWDEVETYMHLESPLKQNQKEDPAQEAALPRSSYRGYSGSYADDKELEEIFTRTFGPVKRERNLFTKTRDFSPAPSPVKTRRTEAREEYLLVDGYNIIFSWDELRELAELDIQSARDKLMDILSDYQGYRKMTLILVFDAYKVQGGKETVEKYHNIFVVYTKEAETADQYIEKTVHRIGRQYQVTVATSDGLEQVIILGQGAVRLSASGLLEEIREARREMRKEYLGASRGGKTYLFDSLSEEMAGLMEEVRLGKRSLDESKGKKEGKK